MVEQDYSQYWMGEYDSLQSKFDKLLTLSKNFVQIDDEVHSCPEGEACKVIEERAERYTEARKQLLLYIKDYPIR